MKKLFLLILALSSASVLAKPKNTTCHGIDIENILPIGYQLATEAKENSYTLFVFEENGDFQSDNQLNIQFSIEKKKFGLDWVLKAPRNIKDSAKFREFAEESGYKVEERKMNGVDYLRVEEGGSLFSLCKSVITELYGIPENAEICLKFSGISFD